MTTVVSKQTPSQEELHRWLATPEGFIQGLADVDEEPLRLARYQLDLLRDSSKFRALEKARGVGFSFICAAEALAKAHLRPNYTAVFCSLNLEEAVEKIRYANLLHDSLPLKWQKKKVVDNKMAIEFEDAAGRHRSRLISHPCKDPRGKHKADVFLDEFAHYGHKQRGIYVAAVPIVSRGNGQLTIGSTPLMVGDLFHEIVKEERRKYPMFTRQSIPWWACPEFTNDVARAMAEAPGMDTAERVHEFGKPTLVDIFHTMEQDDFRQEYELSFNDESQTFFPYELIFACCQDELQTWETIDSLLKNTEGDLFAGFDVGRTRNTSELIVLEKTGKPGRRSQGGGGRVVYRMGKSFDRSRFQEQEAYLRQMLKASARFRRLCIDRHGIGMNLAENLRSEFRSRVEGIALVGQVKETLAVDLKIAFENEAVAIPRARELTAQIHSIKKTATEAGYARFDTEKNERHHADKFWALALGVHAAGLGKERKRKRQKVSASIV